MERRILLAGFGGQGILFAGRCLVNLGLIAGDHVTWLPSYGPEMRGGTCHCSVVRSQDPISSPIVNDPDIFICMNRPSLDRFEENVRSGGIIVADTSTIDRPITRTDLTRVEVPATQLATDHDLKGMANIILLGALHHALDAFDPVTFEAVLRDIIPAKREALIAPNLSAYTLGHHSLQERARAC